MSLKIITHKVDDEEVTTTTDKPIDYYFDSISVDVGDGERIEIMQSDIVSIEDA